MLFFARCYFESANQHPVQRKRTQPNLPSAIATLRGELERVRDELVVREKTRSEMGVQIEALKRIATEKFRFQMAEFNEEINTGRIPEGTPLPNPNDLPEEHKIQLLWDSLERLGGLPQIDPQACMTLRWLPLQPLAKVVLDELDRLKVLSHPRLDNIKGMIAFLATFPGAAAERRALSEQTP